MRNFIITNFVGQHVRQVRLSSTLSLRDVAMMIGYRNVQKGMKSPTSTWQRYFVTHIKWYFRS